MQKKNYIKTIEEETGKKKIFGPGVFLMDLKGFSDEQIDKLLNSLDIAYAKGYTQCQEEVKRVLNL